ncbi:MAG: hypothetical protein ACLGHO_04500 [Gammaproteobacteria bacterium]
MARRPPARRGRLQSRDDYHPAKSPRTARQRICIEAARIMAEEGVRDFQSAKRKAATRLALDDARDLPTNEEIERALQQHLQLFHGDALANDVRRLRRLALEAMQFLSDFDPRLVGPVLSGTVAPEAEIQLHVRADTPETVDGFLRDRGIPFRMTERRLRFGDRYQSVPSYRFTADGVNVELYVFDPQDARETPLSPVDGRPMQRANAREVEALLREPER